MPEPRTFLKGSSAREHVFVDGGRILKLSLNAEVLKAFIDQHRNERGYLNLVVAERREKSERGDTHYIYLDTWKPKEGQGARRPEPQQNPNAKIDQEDVPGADDNSVPF